MEGPKFKVGDRVRVLKCASAGLDENQLTGTINYRPRSFSRFYGVQLDNYKIPVTVYEEDLWLIESELKGTPADGKYHVENIRNNQDEFRAAKEKDDHAKECECKGEIIEEHHKGCLCCSCLSPEDKFVPKELLHPKYRQGYVHPKADRGIKTTLPMDSTARKGYPIFEGVIKYFPAAIAGCARVSKIGNDKHNPGEAMHHARGKSTDHGDCIQRHMMDLNEDYGKGVGRDENGIPQVDYIVWRACAQAQEWHEKNDGAPLAPNAKEG
jgi:hypothetical protein